MSTTPNKKRGRPSKAATAAAQLGGWDRHAEPKPAAKSKRGRPSARTIAARTLAAKRNAALTQEQRSAIASAGGRAAPNPNPPQLRPCEHCSKSFSARDMRKHVPQCPQRYMARLQAKSAKRRER
jgi:hypothetical protein